MDNDNRPEPEPLLTVTEVAVLFRVDRRTVNRWAQDGKLHGLRTPGGARRFREADVRALVNGGQS